MARNNDDIFKPKLGRIRSLGGARAKTYVNRVLHQISAAGRKGFGSGAGSRVFSGYRIGRGNDTLRHRRAGHRFGPSYRRVIIKTRITKFNSGGPKSGIGTARAHLRYIQRDGVAKENGPGRLYDASHGGSDTRSIGVLRLFEEAGDWDWVRNVSGSARSRFRQHCHKGHVTSRWCHWRQEL